MKNINNQNGFTLMELTIVVAILSLIVAFFVPNLVAGYNNTTIRLAAAQTAKQITDIQSAATSYQANIGTNATSISDIVTAGYLKASPIPAQNVTAFTDTFTSSRVSTNTVSTDICSKFNELYAGGSLGAAPPAAISASLDMQCYGAAAPYAFSARVY